MQETSSILNCNGCAFFVFSNNFFSQADKKKLTIQKTVVEGKYIDCTCLSDDYAQNCVFDKLADSNNAIYTKNFMSYPIIDSQGTLLATIQMESKFKIIGGKEGSKLDKKKHYFGFTAIDEEVMQILANILKMKLEEIRSNQRARQLEDEVIDTL